jgi:hypothetical protein
MHGLLAGAALPVERGAGHRLRPPGGQHGVAGDVPRLLADLRHTAPDHVLHVVRIEAGPPGQLAQHVGGQIDRMDPRQPAVAPAHRGPDRADDHRITHGSTVRRTAIVGP